MSTLPRGRIKDVPEDFIVEELPAYEPQGTGDHLYVRFTKRNLTTDDAVRAIAHAVGVQARDVGVAGMKDKVGVTTQTISLPVPRVDAATFDARVAALSLPGIVIHEAKRHANKLKTGHLTGNRFTIVIRGLAAAEVDTVVASLEKAGREGIPNAFGSQRFGRDRDNAAQALAWLTGKGAGPRDPRKKRFLWSALQSALFNEVLERRVADGTWRLPLAGDILKKTDSGGLFDCTDEATDQARAAQGEVSPTGPMFGAKMREPRGKPGELERAVFVERLGADFDLAKTKPFGEGTRRGLCLGIEGMTVTRDTIERSVKRDAENPASLQEQDARLTVCFVLPKGAYATSVLGAAVLFEPEMSTGAVTTSPSAPPRTDDASQADDSDRVTESESDLE